MEYKLTIERSEPNPDYKPQRKMIGMYSDPYDVPKLINVTVLDCVLTEEQFKAIKAEVFKTFI